MPQVCREALHKDLQSLEEKRELLAVDVPVDLLRTIDEGGNPDVFTADIFERANRSNQLSKGKAQAFASFRSSPPHITPARMASLATGVSLAWLAWPTPGPGSRHMTIDRGGPPRHALIFIVMQGWATESRGGRLPCGG